MKFIIIDNFINKIQKMCYVCVDYSIPIMISPNNNHQ